MSEFDRVVEGIRELEAERTKYKKKLETIRKLVKKMPYQFVSMELYYSWNGIREDFEFTPWFKELEGVFGE